jgi:hypothetical protein
MQKLLVLMVALVAALAAGGAAAAPSVAKADPTVAPRVCRALQATMGAHAFRAAFKAFGTCVSRVSPVDTLSRESAEAQCRAEQNDPAFAASHDGKTFDAFYGRGQSGKNAFANCVTTKLRATVAVIQRATPNPAQSCRSMRSSMTGPTFALAFGTNANHANAFGKCVSHVARGGAAGLVAAAQACTAEQADPSFAASHGGKTFAQTYGTNADLSNAFGKCVAQKAKAAAAEQRQKLLGAARACKTERRSNPAAFRSAYGNKPNAFAKCVAAKS